VVIGTGGWMVVGSSGRVVAESGGWVVVGTDVVVGIGVVAAGATGVCTFPVDLLLLLHAPARAISNASAATVVVFIQRLLVA
jgi:hypothetical protein